MMLPKPEARKRIKARTKRQQAAQRKACVDTVWRRDASQCQVCGIRVYRLDEAANALRVGHVHEIVYRSRGGSSTDPVNSVLVCPSCHQSLHQAQRSL